MQQATMQLFLEKQTLHLLSTCSIVHNPAAESVVLLSLIFLTEYNKPIFGPPTDSDQHQQPLLL
jgi:hypothetical protein